MSTASKQRKTRVVQENIPVVNEITNTNKK